MAFGATLALFLTPQSGEDLSTNIRQRWEEAMEEARVAMEEKEKEMHAQFEQMKQAP